MRLIAVLTLMLSLAVTPRAFALNAGEVELTREGRASIEMALQHLASRQRADGSLSGNMGNTTAIVAAAALAWMAQGNLPGEGPYGKNVAKAVDYLLSCAQPCGYLFKGAGGQSYHHGMAAIALAEVWGQTRDKRIYDKLKKAIDLTIHFQNDKGGWHYNPKVEPSADLSTTVMQLMALRAAKDAGIAVPKETIDKAIQYVESCRTPKDEEGLSGFSYGPGGGRTWSTTSLGVMSLMLAGEYKPTHLKDGLDYLMKARERKEDKTWFVYGHYYGAMAMYQAGGHEKFRNYWTKWYPDVSKQIIKSQVTGGGDRGMYNIDTGYGLWSTGMCALIVAIPYRYLPVYQR
jgi:hypothetical protein